MSSQVESMLDYYIKTTLLQDHHVKLN